VLLFKKLGAEHYNFQGAVASVASLQMRNYGHPCLAAQDQQILLGSPENLRYFGFLEKNLE